MVGRTGRDKQNSSVASKRNCWEDRYLRALQGFRYVATMRKRQFGVGMRAGTNASQRVPADFALGVLPEYYQGSKIEPPNIISVEHTMVHFDMPRGKTNNVKVQKDIRIKTTKA